jgi:uncharacterized protein YhfF
MCGDQVAQVDSRVDQFWNVYLQSLPQTAFPKRHVYEAFCFGNSERLANACADLVMRGIKTSTSALLWEYEAKGKTPPQAGDLSIVTNWNGEPLCIIETLEVTIVPFRGVEERFVSDYGEGDRSLNWWHTGMWEYYSKECARLGRSPSTDMPVVCERFQVVFMKKD